MDAARAHAEAVKVEDWCTKNGIQSTSDLAFWFTSFDEAMNEAGRAVATAWEVARKSTGVGLQVLVRQLFAAESAGQVAPDPAPPVRRPPVPPPVVIRPTKAKSFRAPVPGQRSGYQTEQVSPAVSDDLSQAFGAMLNEIGLLPGDSSSSSDTVAANYTAYVNEVCRRSEGATLKRALHTWDDLKRAAQSAGLTDLRAQIDGHFLAKFVRESPAQTRVWQGLFWLKKNMPVELDMRLVVVPRRQKGGQYGGGRQAPVLQPPMIGMLDQLLEAMVDTPQWSVMMGAFCMMVALIRFAHLQRSTLVHYTQYVLTFFCHRGKQLGNRSGFYWSAPRHSILGFDLLPPLLAQLQAMKDLCKARSKALNFLVFDLDAGLPLNIRGFVDAVRFHLGVMVENVGELTSYSLRRVGPSVAGLAELSVVEKVALGGWLDKSQGVAATPARYDATKERLSAQLKLALRYTLLWIFKTMSFTTWGEVSLRACKNTFRSGMDRADMLMADEGAIIAVSPLVDNRPVLRVLKMRGLKMLRGRRGQGDVVLPVEDQPDDTPASADAFFNEAATRWVTPGHAGRPEPPTLVYRRGEASIWLGGLPREGDSRWLRQQGVTLILSAMDSTAESNGGISSSAFLQKACCVTYNGASRMEAWNDLRNTLISTLAAGESVYVHCKAGVHRGPILCAMCVATAYNISFNDVYARIENLRAIDRQGVLSRRGGNQVFNWAAETSNKVVAFHVKTPIEWVASAKAGSLWHVSSIHQATDRLQPWCRWRQSTRQSVFKNETITANTAEEAIVYGRPFCKSCLGVTPASAQLTIGDGTAMEVFH